MRTRYFGRLIRLLATVAERVVDIQWVQLRQALIFAGRYSDPESSFRFLWLVQL